MVRFLFALVLGLAPLSASAGDAPLSAEAFEAYVTGKTLSYAKNGRPFGAEDYLDGRRVRWSYLDDECMEGVWYPEGEMICFAYDGIAVPQYWSFFLDGDGLRARFENRPGASDIYETAELANPLMCPGPRIGV